VAEPEDEAYITGIMKVYLLMWPFVVRAIRFLFFSIILNYSFQHIQKFVVPVQFHIQLATEALFSHVKTIKV
jgi:hypothetical protein